MSATHVDELLRGHVTLQVECIDRLYLNGYIPRLQTGAGLVGFLTQHRRQPIPSPALLGQITQRFVADLKEFACGLSIPLIAFEHGQRKDDIAQRLRAQRNVRDQVVFIGVAQEKAHAFSARKLGTSGSPQFDYHRDKTVYVNHYYYYLDDAEWGEGFLKVCSYAPWGIKLCLNGHEWVKRQLQKRGIGFESLDNGFLSCADPKQLQALCDQLGPSQVEAFLHKWQARLPLPLDTADREAGYGHQLSIWQMEVSLTQVMDRPLAGRQFFEEVIRDNLDLGRADRVQLLFARKITKATPGQFRTRVIQQGVQPSLHIEYKQCDVKQYFKEGRGLRTETTFRNPGDFGVNKGLLNFSYLQKLGRQINRRLLEVERVSQNCGMSAASIQRVVQPTETVDGQKAPGLRFGDPRVMAVLVALTLFVHVVDGFRNRSLRRHVASLLGVKEEGYTASQMSYDLRRLQRKGLIFRAQKSHRYYLSPYGWKVARLYARLEARVFRPALTAMEGGEAALPAGLEKALQTVDAEIDRLIEHAFPQAKAG